MNRLYWRRQRGVSENCPFIQGKPNVVEGLSNAEIGRRLYLSESTIKQHLRAAYKLLGVSNRTEAANLFCRGN